jgi:hypothetical protein
MRSASFVTAARLHPSGTLQPSFVKILLKANPRESSIFPVFKKI